MNMLADFMNITVIYEKSSYGVWGNIDEYCCATKDLKLLQQNQIDLVLGGYVKTSTRALLFDSSQTHIQESLVLCVPHQLLVIGIKNFLSVLRPDVWVFVLVLYFLVSFLMWRTSLFKNDEYISYTNMSHCLLNNFLVFIGFTVNTLPKTIRVRYFMSIFIIFSLKLNMLYTSYLTSILSSPNYREKYGNMEEIYNYNLETYFVPNSKMFFQGNDNKRISNVPLSTIRKRWRNCSDIPKCFNSLLSGNVSAVCMPQLYKEYLLNHQKGKNKRSIHCLQENVISFPLTILMRKGFPLFHLFDIAIGRIVAAGFVDKWTKDILMTKPEKMERHPEENVYIDFNDLVPVFYTVLFGFASAFVTFIIEIVVKRLK